MFEQISAILLLLFFQTGVTTFEYGPQEPEPQAEMELVACKTADGATAVGRAIADMRNLGDGSKAYRSFLEESGCLFHSVLLVSDYDVVWGTEHPERNVYVFHPKVIDAQNGGFDYIVMAPDHLMRMFVFALKSCQDYVVWELNGDFTLEGCGMPV